MFIWLNLANSSPSPIASSPFPAGHSLDSQLSDSCGTHQLAPPLRDFRGPTRLRTLLVGDFRMVVPLRLRILLLQCRDRLRAITRTSSPILGRAERSRRTSRSPGAGSFNVYDFFDEDIGASRQSQQQMEAEAPSDARQPGEPTLFQRTDPSDSSESRSVASKMASSFGVNLIRVGSMRSEFS